jgi:beta-mannosidase
MVRLWGGNVYPDEEFYTFCDREGIMVWQDFSMACALYPQDTLFQTEIQREVGAVVAHYANHPALVVWCGDNEVDQMARGRRIPTTSNVLTRHTIPDVLAVEDPHRPYLPSSPFISQVVDGDDRFAMPEVHLWGPRDYFKSEFYTHYQAPFVSEIGFMGLPSKRSLRRFLDVDQMWPPDNRQWLVHATDPTVNPESYYWERARKTFDRAEEYFGSLPTQLSDIVLASQIVQAEGFKFAVEWARQHREKTGLLWWSLFDGWPQVSDAVVDYFLQKKLAYYYLAHAQNPLLALVGEPDESGRHPLWISNHQQRGWHGPVQVTDGDSGQSLWEGRVSVDGGELLAVARLEFDPEPARLLLLHWQDGEQTFCNHYVVGRPPFSLTRYRDWLAAILGAETARQYLDDIGALELS